MIYSDGNCYDNDVGNYFAPMSSKTKLIGSFALANEKKGCILYFELLGMSVYCSKVFI